jgi:two-component system KDP operon response regulator KdpE
MDECEALMPEVTGEGRGLGPVPLILLSRVPLGAKRAVAPELPAGVSVVRPFAIAELLSRVHAALGQPQDVDGDEVLQAGNVRMDFTRRVITKCGREVRLSRREYDLLQCLAANPDHVVEQRQILKAVWGEGHMDDTHYLRVHMRQLRRKLEDHPAAPCLLVTEPGVGYRLCIHG